MPESDFEAAEQNLSKISSRDERRRLPSTMGGFSVNFCRNPRCDRFGTFPDPFAGKRRSSEANRGKVSGSGEERSYFCPSCGIATVVKSNRAIAEEYCRLRRERRQTNGKHCQNSTCANHGLSVLLSPSSYFRFGTTAKGDPRFRYKACGKTFSTGRPTRRHKQTDDTGAILKSLVNKMPLSRICEVHDVSRKQIYTKIDFLYRQAVAFSTACEARIGECLADRSAWLATDIQVILVNWPVKNRRGTIPLLHMATVHKFSQFVVAATVDLDESTTPEALEEAMEQCGDFALPRSMRRHARLWAHSEYEVHFCGRSPGCCRRMTLPLPASSDCPDAAAVFVAMPSSSRT